MSKSKLVSKCYLETLGVDHSQIPPLYLKQMFFVGKLFPHNYVCAWCLLKLQDAAKALDTDLAIKQQFTDVEAQNSDQWRVKNPAYVKIINEIGIDVLKTELKRNISEVPFEPEVTETMNRPLKITNDSGEVRTITEEEWERKRLHITVD